MVDEPQVPRVGEVIRSCEVTSKSENLRVSPHEAYVD